MDGLQPHRLARRASAIWLALVALALVVLAPGGAAQAKCQLQDVADLHVSLERGRVLVDGEINGQPARFILDTGAVTSMLFGEDAARLKLAQGYVGSRLSIYGVGGQVHVWRTSVGRMRLDRYEIRDATMLIAMGRKLDPEASGLLGQDLLSPFDVEFDLAHNTVRLLKPSDCHGDEVVYWGGGYGMADLQAAPESAGAQLDVRLNGHAILAELDTGAPASTLDLAGAQAVGVTPRTPGVTPVGYAGGVSGAATQSWVAPFESFSIGDETIHHAKIRMGNLFRGMAATPFGSRVPQHFTDMPDMLLGLDFVRAHRVLIANSQRKLYFTYLGGAVFDTPAPTGPAPAPPTSGAPAPASQAPAN